MNLLVDFYFGGFVILKKKMNKKFADVMLAILDDLYISVIRFPVGARPILYVSSYLFIFYLL